MKALPARLTAEQVAELIGCQVHDIRVLVRFKLLTPLGKPCQQNVKYFARVDIEKKAEDVKWLSKVTAVLYQNSRENNGKRDGDTI